jgi:hypothetical protein
VSPVEPEEPGAAPEADQLHGDPISSPDGPAEPKPTRDPNGSPSDAAHTSERRIEPDNPAKPSSPFATTIPFEPMAATQPFEPAAATRAFEPVGATRTFESCEPDEPYAPDQPNEPYKRTGPMTQDDLRQHQNPVSHSTGQRRPAPVRTPDVVSIAAGLVFFALGAAYLLASSGHLTVNAAWTVSLLFIGLGLSGFLGAAINSRRRR